MLFPYRIRIVDPGMMQVLRILQKNRVAAIRDGNISKRLGRKLKPIRQDIYFGMDKRYKRSFVALSHNIEDISIKPAFSNKKGFDIVFKWKY